MVIKISRLTSGPGGNHYALNSTKSRMFAHSAVCYWDVFLKLDNINNDNFQLWHFMFVGLPMMHMSLELMVKAFVTFYDSEYNSSSRGHKTSEIISEHAHSINLLKLINDDPQKMELIRTLELAWIGLRYAECSLSYDGKDGILFNEMMTLLTDEYKKISRLRTL